MKLSRIFAALLVFGMPLTLVNAQEPAAEIDELRQMMDTMRAEYDARISDLEERLARTEGQSRSAKRDADEAFALAEQTAIDATASSSAPNTFNPSLGAIISGQYASVGSGWEQIPGFQPAGEIGSGESGFSLGEAELNINANIDANYFGNVTFAIADEGGEVAVELEEASLQTTALPAGLSVMGGRFFSATGYLNGFHPHSDDFADRPLPYQAFVGGRYTVDGLQARWVAPTSLLFELGSELNWGSSFPATANGEKSPGAWTLFTKLGGDVGNNHSWQFGFSWIQANAVLRGSADDPDSFTGDSDLAVADFVWKWAPGGNAANNSVKLQGEYFRRSESGRYAGLPYAGDQDGWYLQGVWKFSRTFRAGLRHDIVTADNGVQFGGTLIEDFGRSSSRDSVMLDWSPSEFGRLRMQYTNDRVLPEADDQWVLQYIMSIGAHAAHQF